MLHSRPDFSVSIAQSPHGLGVSRNNIEKNTKGGRRRDWVVLLLFSRYLIAAMQPVVAGRTGSNNSGVGFRLQEGEKEKNGGGKNACTCGNSSSN